MFIITCFKIRDEHSTSISNNSVISILRSRAFFEDVGYLANTLLPIKLAILEVEGRSTNLADCYISLLRIAAVIRNLPSNDYKFFRNHCISVLIKGKNCESWKSLSTQLRLYKLQKDDNGVPNVYSASYTPNQDTRFDEWIGYPDRVLMNR
ncbi:8879_t:CDS:2 [Entrophospora sp. SA101]|nr:8879_t:CDS:2 [Entrophospora sp. SA101]